MGHLRQIYLKEQVLSCVRTGFILSQHKISHIHNNVFWSYSMDSNVKKKQHRTYTPVLQLICKKKSIFIRTLAFCIMLRISVANKEPACQSEVGGSDPQGMMLLNLRWMKTF